MKTIICGELDLARAQRRMCAAIAAGGGVSGRKGILPTERRDEVLCFFSWRGRLPGRLL